MSGSVSLVGALAWPLATLSIVLLFRQDLKSMLGRVGGLKYRNVEVTFRDELNQAESLARSIPSQGKVVLEVESGASAPALGGAIIGHLKSADPRHEGHDGLDHLAARSPRQAIFEAWTTTGQALIKAATTRGDRRVPAPTRADEAARFLVDRGWLAGPDAQLLERLRRLRDQLSQQEDLVPSAEESRRFVDLALPLASRIEAIG